MTLSLVPAAPVDARPRPFTLVILTDDDLDADTAGAMRDGMLRLRTNASFEQQMWVIEQAIRSMTDRPFEAVSERKPMEVPREC